MRDMFGDSRKYDTRYVTELSSGKYFGASLRLGLVLGLGLGLRVRVWSETCSVIKGSTILVKSPRARVKTRPGVRCRATARVRFIYPSFFGNIHRCMLGCRHRTKARVRGRVRVRVDASVKIKGLRLVLGLGLNSVLVLG